MRQAKYSAGYSAAFRLVEGFLELLEQRGMNRADLARRLGVKRSAVTKWFSPNRNLTVFTAAMIAEALGAELRFEFVDTKACIENSASKTESIHALPGTPAEYRNVTSGVHSTTEAVVTTAPVSIPRQFARGIETGAVRREHIQLHAV
ncbi:helix-turn-helix transcriptional regulator [Myxococcaceae bacterium GXIMD 01537]